MKKEVKGSDFLALALYAFAGFAMELLLVNLIEPWMGWQAGSLADWQNIVHWLVTSAAWVLLAHFLIRVSRQKYGFDIWAQRSTLGGRQRLLVLACVAVMAYAQYLDWGGFKPYLEYVHRGPLLFVFQYIYYFFEALLFSLIIIFGQKACEIWFRNTKIPYGGIVLALTWGLGHILSKGSLAVGLLSAAGGFLMGASYLIVGRDYRKALPLFYILFVI